MTTYLRFYRVRLFRFPFREWNHSSSDPFLSLSFLSPSLFICLSLSSYLFPYSHSYSYSSSSTSPSSYSSPPFHYPTVAYSTYWSHRSNILTIFTYPLYLHYRCLYLESNLIPSIVCFFFAFFLFWQFLHVAPSFMLACIIASLLALSCSLARFLPRSIPSITTIQSIYLHKIQSTIDWFQKIKYQDEPGR